MKHNRIKKIANLLQSSRNLYTLENFKLMREWAELTKNKAI